MLADDIAEPAGVGLGNLLGGDTDGLDEEVVDRQLVLAVRGGVEGLAKLEELADGDAGGDEEVGVGLGGLDETGGNGLAHAADGDVLVGSAGSSDNRGRDSLLDILLGDLTALAGSLDVADVDALLLGEADGGERGVGLTLESVLELAGGLVEVVGRVLGLGGRGRLGLGLLLGLLLGGGLGLTTGVGGGETLEGADIGALLDEDGNGL